MDQILGAQHLGLCLDGVMAPTRRTKAFRRFSSVYGFQEAFLGDPCVQHEAQPMVGSSPDSSLLRLSPMAELITLFTLEKLPRLTCACRASSTSSSKDVSRSSIKVLSRLEIELPANDFSGYQRSDCTAPRAGSRRWGITSRSRVFGRPETHLGDSPIATSAKVPPARPAALVPLQ